MLEKTKKEPYSINGTREELNSVRMKIPKIAILKCEKIYILKTQGCRLFVRQPGYLENQTLRLCVPALRKCRRNPALYRECSNPCTGLPFRLSLILLQFHVKIKNCPNYGWFFGSDSSSQSNRKKAQANYHLSLIV